MPLIPNLSLYLIQKFDRLALWGNLTILELHFAESQASQMSCQNKCEVCLMRGNESELCIIDKI